MAAEDSWDIRSALDWTVGFLERKEDPHPRRSAEWLLSEATDLSRIELYAYHDRPLSLEERDVLREGVRRRARGEPLQYVTGEVAFHRIVVRAEKGVLIPRPETEVLVELVLEELDDVLERQGSARILEIGTGTGCISLAIASARPDADLAIVATDIAPEAVGLARRNISAHGQDDRITVIESDLVDRVSPDLLAPFDILVSNPPYIPSAEVDTLEDQVRCYEPRMALDGGEDGLDVFRRIAELGTRVLVSGGFLAVELHENSLDSARTECVEWYHQALVHRDLADRDRVLTARLSGASR